MTGAQFCRQILERAGIECDVTHGHSNGYVPGERLISLRPHIYNGTSRKHLTLAAHEAGHAEQHHQLGWFAPLLRWLLLGRLLLEWDASRRARRLMQAEGREAREDALKESWRAYLIPAIWQAGVMLVVGGAYFLSHHRK